MKEFFLMTDRLGFSTWSWDDLPDAQGLWGDPAVARYITADGVFSSEQVKMRLQKEMDTLDAHGTQYWPVYLHESGQFAGCCGLRPYREGILELGVHLRPSCWGRGLAAEACRAAMEYGFDVCRVGALFAGHNPQNAASAKMLKKLGFVYTHDELYPPTGLFHPSYRITKEEFQSQGFASAAD